MLTISDGGGGYGGTSWAGMSVMDMWLAIGNQDTTAHWQVVDGWRKSYELTLQHKAQVQSYRDNLANAWPPEKSPASAAYLARLDELITHLQGTYDAAVANHSAFSSATLALSMARTDLEQVVNEYIANQGKLAEFEASKQTRPVGMGKYVVPHQTTGRGRPPTTTRTKSPIHNVRPKHRNHPGRHPTRQAGQVRPRCGHE